MGYKLNYALIGKRLAYIRHRKGWTQSELAEKCDLNEKYISPIETAHSIPSIQTILILCKALNISPNYLLFGIEEENDPDLISEIVNKLRLCDDKQLCQISAIIDALLKEY